MHNMNEIIEKIKEKATKAGYPDASVEVREINKSNKTKTGLILRLQPEDKICPTIYPEEIEPAALDNIIDNLIQTAVDAQNAISIEEIQTQLANGATVDENGTIIPAAATAVETASNSKVTEAEPIPEISATPVILILPMIFGFAESSGIR